MYGLATPTAELRETLVAQGYSEAVADAIIAVAGAARDEAIEQAAERNGHSISILTTRFESHEKQNDADFRTVESAIRETVANAVTELKDVTTELKDELTKEQVLNERRFSQVQTTFSQIREDIERRFSEQSAAIERRFSEVHSEIAKLDKQTERRFSEVMSESAKLRGEMGELRGELEHRMFVLGLGLAGLIIGATGAVIAAVAIFNGS